MILDLIKENTINDEIVVEGLGRNLNPSIEGATEIIYESLCDASNIEEAVFFMNAKAVKALHENNTEAFTTLLEADVPSFIDKMIAGAKKLWGMLTDLFVKMKMYIDQAFKNDKNWIKTYEDAISKADDSNAKIKGYTFAGLDKIDASTLESDFNTVLGQYDATLEKVTAAKSKPAADISATVKDISGKGDEIKGKLRGKAIGKDSATKEEFNSGIHELVYGSAEPVEVPVKKNEFLAVIKSTDEDLKIIKKDEKGVNDRFKKIISNLNDIKKNFGKVENDEDRNRKAAIASYVSTVNSLTNSASSLVSGLCGVKMTAIKRRRSMYKTALNSIIMASRRSMRESTFVNLE